MRVLPPRYQVYIDAWVFDACVSTRNDPVDAPASDAVPHDRVVKPQSDIAGAVVYIITKSRSTTTACARSRPEVLHAVSVLVFLRFVTWSFTRGLYGNT